MAKSKAHSNDEEGTPKQKPILCDTCHATELPCLCTPTKGERIVSGTAKVLGALWRMNKGTVALREGKDMVGPSRRSYY